MEGQSGPTFSPELPQRTPRLQGRVIGPCAAFAWYDLKSSISSSASDPSLEQEDFKYLVNFFEALPDASTYNCIVSFVDGDKGLPKLETLSPPAQEENSWSHERVCAGSTSGVPLPVVRVTEATLVFTCVNRGIIFETLNPASTQLVTQVTISGTEKESMNSEVRGFLLRAEGFGYTKALLFIRKPAAPSCPWSRLVLIANPDTADKIAAAVGALSALYERATMAEKEKRIIFSEMQRALVLQERAKLLLSRATEMNAVRLRGDAENQLEYFSKELIE